MVFGRRSCDDERFRCIEKDVSTGGGDKDGGGETHGESGRVRWMDKRKKRRKDGKERGTLREKGIRRDGGITVWMEEWPEFWEGMTVEQRL